VVIEHNLDVIRSADHVIDLGPEGGSGGGRVMAEGTPEQVEGARASFTGQFLAERLEPGQEAVGA
jgi:excinuclease ABC subunit A